MGRKRRKGRPVNEAPAETSGVNVDTLNTGAQNENLTGGGEEPSPENGMSETPTEEPVAETAPETAEQGDLAESDFTEEPAEDPDYQADEEGAADESENTTEAGGDDPDDGIEEEPVAGNDTAGEIEEMPGDVPEEGDTPENGDDDPAEEPEKPVSNDERLKEDRQMSPGASSSEDTSDGNALKENASENREPNPVNDRESAPDEWDEEPEKKGHGGAILLAAICACTALAVGALYFTAKKMAEPQVSTPQTESTAQNTEEVTSEDTGSGFVVAAGGSSSLTKADEDILNKETVGTTAQPVTRQTMPAKTEAPTVKAEAETTVAPTQATTEAPTQAPTTEQTQAPVSETTPVTSSDTYLLGETYSAVDLEEAAMEAEENILSDMFGTESQTGGLSQSINVYGLSQTFLTQSGFQEGTFVKQLSSFLSSKGMKTSSVTFYTTGNTSTDGAYQLLGNLNGYSGVGLMVTFYRDYPGHYLFSLLNGEVIAQQYTTQTVQPSTQAQTQTQSVQAQSTQTGSQTQNQSNQTAQGQNPQAQTQQPQSQSIQAQTQTQSTTQSTYDNSKLAIRAVPATLNNYFQNALQLQYRLYDYLYRSGRSDVTNATVNDYEIDSTTRIATFTLTLDNGDSLIGEYNRLSDTYSFSG